MFLLPCQRKVTPASSAEFFKHCACPSGYFVKAVMSFAWRRQSSSAAFQCSARHFSSVGKKLAEPFLPALTSAACSPPAAMLGSPAGRIRLRVVAALFLALTQAIPQKTNQATTPRDYVIAAQKMLNAFYLCAAPLLHSQSHIRIRSCD